MPLMLCQAKCQRALRMAVPMAMRLRDTHTSSRVSRIYTMFEVLSVQRSLKHAMAWHGMAPADGDAGGTYGPVSTGLSSGAAEEIPGGEFGSLADP